MTKEEIQKVLDLSLEYYKSEVFGTNKESEKPSRERIDWIYDKMKGSSEISKDLEEAAKEHVKTLHDIDGCEVGMCRRIFIAGAEWYREQHKLVPEKYAEMDFESARNTFSEDVYNHNRKNKTPIDMIDLDDAFETGSDWMEKHMMKKAVEHYVIGEIAGSPVGSAIVHYDDALNPGDKVKVIIIKEDK